VDAALPDITDGKSADRERYWRWNPVLAVIARRVRAKGFRPCQVRR